MSEPVSRPVAIPAGALFTVSSGEYSDYSVVGVFRAKVEIDTEALMAEYLAEHPDQAARYSFRESGFLAWVARRDLIEHVESFDWYLGAYAASEAQLTGPDSYDPGNT